jgi:hypothetical protein
MIIASISIYLLLSEEHSRLPDAITKWLLHAVPLLGRPRPHRD